MRLFFLALRVRIQVVARPLPHVIEPAQRPPQGVLGRPLLGGYFQDLQEQGDGPAHMWVAQFLGGQGQEGSQQVLVVLVQHRGAPAARFVVEGLGVTTLGVGVDPVVHTLARDGEHTG
jgi:hypothetical protein